MNGCRNNESLNTNNNNNNWLLGFSLSPHLKMEHQQQQQVNAFPDLQIHHFQHHHHQSHQQHGSQLCYADETNGLHMPLKSDGSLCINTSQHPYTQQGMSHGSSPKLENFLGAASMGGDHTNSSLYFHHNVAEPEPVAIASSNSNISHSSLDFVSARENMFHHLYQNQPSEPSHLLQSVTLAQMSTGQTWSETSHQDSEQQMSGKNLVTHGELQALTLSMSPGSQLSCDTAHISPTESTSLGSKKRGFNDVGQKQPVRRKSLDTFGQRTSQFRGVTRHRWTRRYEAHLWDNSCKKEGQTRKGRQVYLGGYDMEEKAARAYDLAAIKYWGSSTHINFSVENYQLEIEEMKKMSRQEYVAHLRRKSSGFSRGASIYRGVTRHHQHGRWQARIGRVAGNKDLYLGTFSTQEEAAEAYDMAAIKFRGVNAVTNFDISRYDVERIIASNTFLAGEIAKRNNIKESSSTQPELIQNHNEDLSNNVQTILDNELVNEATSPVMMFPKPPLTSKLNMNSNVGWLPSDGRHATVAIPNLPVFAAWHD